MVVTKLETFFQTTSEQKLKASSRALFHACKTGDLPEVKRRLSEPGLLNLCDENGKTPLMASILAQEEETSLYILQQPGLDVNVSTPERNTALHFVCQLELHKVFNALLDIEHLNFTQQNKNGHSAADILKEKNNRGMLLSLLTLSQGDANQQPERVELKGNIQHNANNRIILHKTTNAQKVKSFLAATPPTFALIENDHEDNDITPGNTVPTKQDNKPSVETKYVTYSHQPNTTTASLEERPLSEKIGTAFTSSFKAANKAIIWSLCLCKGDVVKKEPLPPFKMKYLLTTAAGEPKTNATAMLGCQMKSTPSVPQLLGNGTVLLSLLEKKRFHHITVCSDDDSVCNDGGQVECSSAPENMQFLEEGTKEKEEQPKLLLPSASRDDDHERKRRKGSSSDDEDDW
eukprot:CAMPEP_0206405842 /NCGR_PEP_ID=MMETSP0294-20121207/29354_1 /ASSEMBLY_ACC=CAM_ASM_000327 /TAXON_ID=39354 /ORGANISM="Heterosigma akashiwo, Strain CCMP2393" /LENGTH=403 /DNA_ID=CAMNT_0053864307 /DNA_START=37 /DNA_END=1246 /DNA_ORIENTATION=-